MLESKYSITEEEIKKEIWNSFIPIVFYLNFNETTSLKTPSPYYV